jgi:hypothetical protein
MIMKRTIVMGLSAASLVFASGLALALGQHSLAVGDSGIAIGDTGPYDGAVSRNRTTGKSAAAYAESSANPRWQQTPAELLVVSIPHRLRKQEALRRLKSGLDSIRQNYGSLFSVQEEIWTGYRLHFRVSMLGQAGSGSIDVTDHVVQLELFLPWPLSKLAEAAVPLIRREGALMLQRK